jgi:DNA-directed DNA polymerase III PolC
MIHLHVHSHYSLLEGLASPQELVEAAVRSEMPALALTDHGRLSGSVEFALACRSAGIQPIFGLELDVLLPVELAGLTRSPVGSAVLLAEDLSGWASLCRLASLAQSDPSGITPLPFEKLAQNNAGLLCLTGGRGGLLESMAGETNPRALLALLKRLKEVFPGRLYVQLQRQTEQGQANQGRLVEAANQGRLPLVGTHSIDYLTPEQEKLQRTLASIRTNRPLGELQPGDAAPPEAHFISRSELQSRFSSVPRALAAAQEIADRCKLDLPLGVPHFPQIDLPPGMSSIQVLRSKAEAGATRLYGPDEAVRQRLDHELEVIEQCGYEVLFLVMEEIVDFAHQSGIPIASRGSASSSLVAHCLGITTPDPVRLNLYFERFLNPARLTPPDIDTDLCSRRRDEVIQFVYRRFGDQRVAMVCTVNRFRSRSALREVAKAHHLTPSQVNELAEALPHRWFGPPDRFSSNERPFAGLEERYRSEQHQEIFEEAAALIGLPRHLSIHPGGVVISPGPMTELVPTQLAAKGIVITQLDLESIEKMGLVKIDLLGIRGLTVMGDVAQALAGAEMEESSSAELVRKPAAGRRIPGSLARQGIAILEAISGDDPATAQAVENGRTIGCFQIESPGMRTTLKEVRARTVDDLMVALALYRPGPLTGGLKDAFVARFRGQQPADYLHLALQPLLEDTFGVILYQEQVLRIAHDLAGFSLVEADMLRRAMSHFDPGKQMQELKERFMRGALERSEVPEAAAGRIWELMAAFAGYGFPKAHAASYARVAWQSAWCKTHHPALFMAAVLANWGGYYGQGVYLTEARRLGLKIQPPHVNHAGDEFSVRFMDGEPVLFMGMNQAKELTRRTQARIQQHRPFTSLMDFLARADPRPLEATNLARAGALQGFGSIPFLLERIERGGWRGGQLSLFEVGSEDVEEWTLEQRAAAQQAVLGVSLVAHPLELAADRIAAAGALSTLEAAARLDQRVRVAGTRQTWRRSRTSSGGYIYFMSLEDLEGMLDVVIFDQVYQRHRQAFRGQAPLLVEGMVELDPERGEPFIRAERAWSLG